MSVRRTHDGTRTPRRGHRAHAAHAWASAALATCAALASHAPRAQEPGPIAPLEMRTCRLAGGKTLTDVEAYARDYRRWLDETEAPAQAIHLWLPQLHGSDLDHDFVWVTTWPDARAMGESMGLAAAAGATWAAQFDALATCASKRNFSTVELRATVTPGRYGPVEIATCALRLGATLDETLDATRTWVDHTETTGSTAAHWLLFKGYGENADVRYLFQWAVGYESYEAFGLDYDKFTNGDGSARYNELFGDLITCDNPRLYAVRTLQPPQW